MDANAAVEDLYRHEWGRIVATLIRLVGDFELAEEVAQESFAAAVDHWRVSGVPEFPRAWIIQTARNRAIDRIRRSKRFEEKLETFALEEAGRAEANAPDYEAALDAGEIPDDRLRLIFTCCHPALALEAQIALTLRTLCGLETEEIARAFLVPVPTMAQRLVRAKKKIATAGIPYKVPEAADLPERLDAVLTVIYLVFTEGYAATRGESLVRANLCAEAIRLARLVRMLTSGAAAKGSGARDSRLTQAGGPPAEATALLALMLLHDSRRDARLDHVGDVILLEDQDRGLWDQAQIAEALPLVDEALRVGPGPYGLQAAIAALHCQASRAADTDWAQIAELYHLLVRVAPSPVVSLNRAVAVAMVDGPAAGLALIDELSAAGDLEDYHLLHAARADLLRRMGARAEAAESYARALARVTNESERRFLERRQRELDQMPVDQAPPGAAAADQPPASQPPTGQPPTGQR